MALVKGSPQLLVETDADGGIGFESARGKQVKLVTSEDLREAVSESLHTVYESEIYPPSTSGLGPVLANLEEWNDWSFHFYGADASNTFSLLVGCEGVSSGQSAVSLSPIDGGSSVTTVVSSGLYKMTYPTVFGDLRVSRGGAGVVSCTVAAVGRKL